MRFYKAQEVADVCAPYEAALWLAFGRVPEPTRGNGGRVSYDDFDQPWKFVELRTSVDDLINEYSLTSDFYEPEELDALGVDVDTDYVKYFNAYMNGSNGVDDLFNEKPRLKMGPPSLAEYESAVIFEKVTAIAEQHIERAKLMVHLALIEGRLQASAYIGPQDWLDLDDNPWAEIKMNAVEVRIPSSFWVNRSGIWSAGLSESSNLPGYLGCWISVQNLFHIFPEPLISSKGMEAQIFGSTAAVHFANTEPKHMNTPNPPRGRGRSKAGEGVIEGAVRIEFEKRHFAGTLPEKQEAMIAECCEWVQDTLGMQISRSTAQRYLGSVTAARKADAQ